MATTNLTRLGDRHKKGKIGVFKTQTDFSELAVSGDVYQMFTLPDNAFVYEAGLFIVTAANSSSSAVADVGFAGGDTLIDGADLKSTANTYLKGASTGNEVVPQLKSAGAVVTMKPTYSGADTAGTYLLIIKYIEMNLDTGELTNFSPTV